MTSLKQQVLNLIKILKKFDDAMLCQFLLQYPDKGLDFDGCDEEYLIQKLNEHKEAKNWVDVANYAFLLEFSGEL